MAGVLEEVHLSSMAGEHRGPWEQPADAWATQVFSQERLAFLFPGAEG